MGDTKPAVDRRCTAELEGRPAKGINQRDNVRYKLQNVKEKKWQAEA